MSSIKSDTADYLSHDVRNRVQIVEGYAGLSDDMTQREAVDEFVQDYERLERVLHETGGFDDRLLESLRNHLDDMADEKVLRNARSTVHSIESVYSLLESNGDRSTVSDVFGSIEAYGEVNYFDDVESREIDSAYGAIVSTKICDFLKHPQEEDQDAEMFAEVYDDEDVVKAYISDNGSGIESIGELRENGKGSDIINEVVGSRSGRFATYTNSKANRIELSRNQPETGALFELRIEKDQSSTSESS